MAKTEGGPASSLGISEGIFPHQGWPVWLSWEQLGCGMCAVEPSLHVVGLNPAPSGVLCTGSIVAITVTVIVVVVLVFGAAAYLKIR